MPTSTNTEPPITKTAAIAYLRKFESKLYKKKVVDEVKKLPHAKQLQFAQARLHLTAVIAKLNASLMREIREDLQAQAKSLKTGIEDVSGSVDKLEGAVKWAKAINGLTSALGRVVPLL